MKKQNRIPLWKRVWRRTINNIYMMRRKKELRNKYHIGREKKNIIIIGEPNHGNLGDEAIFLAEENLFKKYADNANLISINMAVFHSEKDTLKKILRKRDLLVLTGGGNLGNQYMDDENIRRETIRLFPKNRIVIFPQTMYFTEDKIGNIEKQKTAKIYNAHNNLIIVARDYKSYSDMKTIFTGDIRLLPDVVLSLGRVGTENVERKKILLCLRTDRESILSQQNIDTIKQIVISALGCLDRDIILTDTDISQTGEAGTLREETYNKWQEFQKAKLVITDRLHGIIFAAITETPCVALSNYNHKVKETCKWVDYLPYIQYIDNIERLSQAIKCVMSQNHNHYECEEITNKFNQFVEEIMNG